MIRTTISRPLLVLACLLVSFSSLHAQEVRWRTDYAAALKESETTGRPLFVDFYTPACVWCQRLDATTFRDPAVASMLNERFVPLKIDGNQTLWLVQALGIQRYPSTVIAAPDSTIRSTHTGYVDANQMAVDLRRILDETPAVAQSQTP
jgi:thiol:disulfide interchange protein